MLQRASHSGGEVAAAEPRRGGVARGGEVLRVRRWVQELAEVPREAAAKLELARAGPERRAALWCAGERRSREAGRRKEKLD